VCIESEDETFMSQGIGGFGFRVWGMCVESEDETCMSQGIGGLQTN